MKSLLAGFAFGFTLAGCFIGGDPFTTSSGDPTVATPDGSTFTHKRQPADAPLTDIVDASTSSYDAEPTPEAAIPIDAASIPDDASVDASSTQHCIPYYQTECPTIDGGYSCVLAIKGCP